MWKLVQPLVALETKKCFLSSNERTYQQIRNTFILKRRHPPKLYRKGEPLKNLKGKNFIYDLVLDTSNKKQPQIEVILKQYVEGLGNAGDRVFVSSYNAYNNLILPGIAVYSSPENVEKYWCENTNQEKEYSSPSALFTVKSLQRMQLSVVMNREQPWVLKPWHVKACFRKCGFIVPEYAITLPERPISGPDMNIENKQFHVTVTINNKEKVLVRCRIHHWSTDVVNRLPYVAQFWEIDTPAIFSEQTLIPESGETLHT